MSHARQHGHMRVAVGLERRRGACAVLGRAHSQSCVDCCRSGTQHIRHVRLSIQRWHKGKRKAQATSMMSSCPGIALRLSVPVSPGYGRRSLTPRAVVMHPVLLSCSVAARRPTTMQNPFSFKACKWPIGTVATECGEGTAFWQCPCLSDVCQSGSTVQPQPRSGSTKHIKG